MSNLQHRIFSIQSEHDFQSLALEVFDYQYEQCEVYRDFVDHLNRKRPESIEEIPFLPISFFKSHRVTTGNFTEELHFKSSGTGGERSNHFVKYAEVYQQSFFDAYRLLLGEPKEQIILALLPNYLEQGSSSLVYMVDRLIAETNHPLSGFLLNRPEEIIERYNQATGQGKQVVIFGVSYALLDLCEHQPNLSKAIIVETGGMKGRRKELTKAELHEMLKKGLKCEQISSEYGMTELLSQGYSNTNGLFQCPPWMKVLIRQVNDPFSYAPHGKTGGINVIDLANIYSCSFIATQDLGRLSETGFEIMGRFDHSDIRGCNLMVD